MHRMSTMCRWPATPCTTGAWSTSLFAARVRCQPERTSIFQLAGVAVPPHLGMFLVAGRHVNGCPSCCCVPATLPGQPPGTRLAGDVLARSATLVSTLPSRAGHMVPQSKPAEALEMFSRFLEQMRI